MPEEKTQRSLIKLLLYLATYTVGAILLLGGFSLFAWIARPYAALYLFPSQRKSLEKKAELNQVKGDWIIIPAVLIDAPIEHGLTKENLAQNIAHAPGSSYPGEKGNTILEGHNYAKFTRGEQNFFSLLHLIKKGAPVYIYFGGKKYQYVVKDKKILNVENPKLYQNTSDERLTLITCASEWSLDMISTTRRVVVTAKPL